MRLNNIELMRLLPQFMRDDRNAKAFAYAVQSQMIAVTSQIVQAQIYSRIDDLSEELLDELAWQFNIVEYRNDFDVSVKREFVKGCIELHHKRGTVEAVEDIVKKIYGDARIEEWFEYGGEPYHYKIRTSNTSVTDEMIQELSMVVRNTQNVRSHLETVIIEIIESMNVYAGIRVFIIDDVSMCTVDI